MTRRRRQSPRRRRRLQVIRRLPATEIWCFNAFPAVTEPRDIAAETSLRVGAQPIPELDAFNRAMRR